MKRGKIGRESVLWNRYLKLTKGIKIFFCSIYCPKKNKDYAFRMNNDITNKKKIIDEKKVHQTFVKVEKMF